MTPVLRVASGVALLSGTDPFDPLPIPKRLPNGVVRKDGKADIRIRVLIDTVGVADMGTLTVVKCTHPTLTCSVRSAVTNWKFVPAQMSGCKVPPSSNWAAVTGGSKAGGDGDVRR